MGRTQTFDTAEAVRAARSVFWEHGYEGAALPELEQATGLSRSSIYHAFGSKRGLFDAAVESYLDEVIRPRLAPLTGATVAPDALERYLRGLREALLREGTLAASNGCLLLNAAATPIAQDTSVAQIIAGYWAEMHDALHAGVCARVPELGSVEQSLLAEACTGLVVSAFTLVRVAPQEAARCLDVAWALVVSRAGGA
jgi:TetR/AcrR family transcriptional regulator, transcriptional repressor for nem operon